MSKQNRYVWELWRKQKTRRRNELIGHETSSDSERSSKSEKIHRPKTSKQIRVRHRLPIDERDIGFSTGDEEYGSDRSSVSTRNVVDGDLVKEYENMFPYKKKSALEMARDVAHWPARLHATGEVAEQPKMVRRGELWWAREKGDLAPDDDVEEMYRLGQQDAYAKIDAKEQNQPEPEPLEWLYGKRPKKYTKPYEWHKPQQPDKAPEGYKWEELPHSYSGPGTYRLKKQKKDK